MSENIENETLQGVSEQAAEQPAAQAEQAQTTVSEASAPETGKTAQSDMEPFDVKKYFKSFTSVLPFVLFALFSALMFAFYALPVATIRSNSLGSLYSVNSLYADDFELIKYATIVVTGLCAVYAVVSCIIASRRLAKGKDLECGSMSLFFYVGYVAVFVCGVVLSAQVGATFADLGACAKLCVAMPVVFAVLSVASSVVKAVLFGKSKRTLNRGAIAALAIVLVAAVAVGVGLPISQSSFVSARYSAVELGDSASEVRSKLGKPDYEVTQSSTTVFMYLNGEAKKVVKNLEYLTYYNGYLPTEEKIDNLVQEQTDRIQSDLLRTVTKGIVVTFDSDGVSAVMYNADCQNASLSDLGGWQDKRLQKAEVKDVLPYVDWASYDFEVGFYYTDGSYYLTKTYAVDCQESPVWQANGRYSLTFKDASNSKIDAVANFVNVKGLTKQTYDKFEYVTYGDDAVITKYSGSSVNLTIPTTIQGKRVVAVGESAFANNSTLLSVSGASITAIYDRAFEYCKNLESVYFDSVKYIGSRAFSSCRYLESASVSDVKWIAERAFADNVNLAYLDLAGTPLVAIGASAFESCEDLISVVIPSTTEYVGSAAFKNSGVVSAMFNSTDWIAVYNGTRVAFVMDSASTNAERLTNTYVNYTFTKLTEDEE